VGVKPDHDVEALYRDQAEKLWRALYAYAGDREVASDAVAEAFTQCLRRGNAVRTPAKWLWRAAFKIAGAEMKAQRGRVDLPEDGYASSTPYERLTGLLDALSQLPRKQRAALVLHYYCGYTAKESAEILGSTAATVRVHLSQGRRRLRDVLERMDDG
jgi:RNA polymerase sigma-70 factor (ECF subfamily)